ncbi:MAG: chemotaxis protein methyltransferase CheR [Frankiales bacterium]|jgi:chemotaxis protein methyltransferase CheR|nr:chemotaxis protein methyltransferase CheR [Frankiales bacterium]
MKLSLSDSDFARLTRFLHDVAGLVFDETRRDSLGYALGERLPRTAFSEVTPYLDHVMSPEGAEERQQLLDEVTIPETYFFRNPPQIRALGRQVLPELVRANAESKRLVIWSAGCSTGEEPYTVAMLLLELIPDHRDWDIRIIATDVSQRALTAARRAKYGQRSVQLADAERVGRFFDYENGDYVVKPEVRALVTFRHHNLVTDPSPFLSREIDLVLCRNVTIYFNRETTRGLMERFHHSLADGGYLFLGHAETLWQITDAFRLVTLGDAFVYRRVDPPKVERKIGLGSLKAFGWRNGAGPERVEVPVQAAPVEPPAPVSSPSLLSRLQIPVREPAPAAVAPVVDYLPSLQLVHQELAAGRYLLAAEMAESLASREPLLAEAHYLRGMALCNQGRDRDALDSLRKAIYLDSNAGFAHFLLAGALARLGESAAAAASYRAAAETLGRRAGDAVAAELGGRSIAELIVLCRSLAGTADKRAVMGGR